jgi:hypothetical protein
MRKKIIINISLLTMMSFLTVAFIGFIIWNKPHRNIKGANSIETNAVALYRALSNDTTKMKPLFLNKVVVVSGRVKQVQKNLDGAQVILLETNVSGASVNCTMEENSLNIKSGDTTAIKGMCIGYINGDPQIGLPGDVFLTRCYTSF